MYKITNLSRCLTLLGLYPGESKKVNKLDDTIRDLFNHQLISLEEEKQIINKPPTDTKKKDQVKLNNNLEDCEVKDTDGRN